jgi:acyl transferase domain-containing protein
LKAALSLHHGVVPASLHCAEPNPAIDFAALNLALCQKPLLLADNGRSYASINSFGFGGTNAHVVIAPGRKPAEQKSAPRPGFFVLSAAGKPGLIALAQKHLDHIAPLSDGETARVANAVAHRRERLATSLAIAATRRADVSEALHAFIAGAEHPELSWGDAAGRELPLAFVYSGNGSQWPGMGLSACRQNRNFRAHFDKLDDHFRGLAGWSLKDALFSDQRSDPCRARSSLPARRAA